MEKLLFPIIFWICLVTNNYMQAMDTRPVGPWALQNGSQVEGKSVCKTLIQIQKLLAQETQLANLAILSLIVLCANQEYAAETDKEPSRDVRTLLKRYDLVDKHGNIGNTVKNVVESAFSLSPAQIRYSLITQNGGTNPVANALRIDDSQDQAIFPLKMNSPIKRLTP